MSTALFVNDRAFQLGLSALSPKGTWANDGFYPKDVYLPVTQVPDYGHGRSSVFDFDATVDNKRLIWLGISQPLQGSGTFSGTVDILQAVTEGTASNLFFWRLHIWVSVGDTDVVRGTLLNSYEENTTNEWPVATDGQFHALQSPQTLAGVGWQAGDRIIVEAGFIDRNAVSSGVAGRLWYGTSQQAEPYTILPTAGTLGYVQDGTDAGARYGQILFSQTIPFDDEPTFPPPPANDECSNAIVVPSVAYVSSPVDAAGATIGTDPQPSCGGAAFSSFDGAGIWWVWTPSVSENATFDLPGGSGTTLSIWTGSCGALTQVGCNISSTPAITMAVTSGTPYRILASRRFDIVGGIITLRIATTSSPHGVTPGTPSITAYPTVTSISVTSTAASGGTAPYTYQWYRSTVSGFTPDGSTLLSGGTTISYTDTTAVANTQYYYKLVITDATAATGTTAELSARIAVPLTAPSPFGVEPWVTDERVATFLKLQFDWTHNGVDTLLYRIEYCTGLGCNSYVVFASAFAPTTSLTRGSGDSPPVLEDTIYRFRIQAVSSSGFGGPWSNIVEYTTGGRLTHTFNSGAYIGGALIPGSSFVQTVQLFGSFPASFLPSNAILRWVKLTICARKSWEVVGPGHQSFTWTLSPVAVPSAVSHSIVGLPFGVGIGEGDYGFPPPAYICTERTQGMYSYSTDPQDGAQDLPSSDSSDRVNSATNSVALSQAEFYDRSYGWVYWEDNTDTLNPYTIQGLEIDGLTAEVAFDLSGMFVLTRSTPADDVTVCSGTDRVTETNAGATGEPLTFPLLPWTAECAGGGLVPTASAPTGGETW